MDAQGFVLISPQAKESEINSNQRRIEKFQADLVGKKAELNRLEEVKNQEMMVPVVRLGKGKWFGELALRVTSTEDQLKRQATVNCVSDCQFATMSKANF